MKSGIVLSLVLTLTLLAGCMAGEIVADDQPLEADVAYLLEEPDAGAEDLIIRFFCPGPFCVTSCDGDHPDPCCDLGPHPGRPTGCSDNPEPVSKH
jgi:hypothetical protein